MATGGPVVIAHAYRWHEALALLASVPPPPARMRLGRALLFLVLVWWCGAAPMMSGLYLRRPEKARAASVT